MKGWLKAFGLAAAIMTVAALIIAIFSLIMWGLMEMPDWAAVAIVVLAITALIAVLLHAESRS